MKKPNDSSAENQVRFTMACGSGEAGRVRKARWQKAADLVVGKNAYPNGALLEWIRRVLDAEAFKIERETPNTPQ